MNDLSHGFEFIHAYIDDLLILTKGDQTDPMPKINEMLLKLEGFQYATSLDLNMGYYNI